ncbi:Appr-1-p processing protein [Guyparkeria sp. SCN-R1]|uniref:macro domain-containing protein n=1 Tax=Guyparkeria sp. SCN-R1 TaxID=2341113 RepID=UPI000F653159|nr:macro domain-containing protein [Guyparkeria sp. SCN-R1]RRQ23851.1 Appr-1-p processing protein [Guyparkeria sp. SCN-R1]
MDFSIIQGNIATQSADCLVNAAGTSLAMGSGVAGALRDAASGPINEAAMAQGSVPLGGVAVTQGFDLPARWVIHAAAMPHYGDGRATEHSIRAAVRNTLAKADELGCCSMVIPPLGCGVAGFDFATGVRLILEEIDRYEPVTLTDLRLIVYREADLQVVEDVARAVRGG